MPDLVFDPEEFVAIAVQAAGEESRALAENVARNQVESIRQQRNGIEAGLEARKTLPEISDLADLTPTPKQKRDVQASFENHLKAMFRRAADETGRKLRARTFMGVKLELPGDRGQATGDGGSGPRTPDSGLSARVLSLDEALAADLPNLGPHPHSTEVAIPIPPAFDGQALHAARLLRLTPRARAAWLLDANEARARGRATPPIP